MNRYYIIEVFDENIAEIGELIVGDFNTQRYSKDLNYMIVKLPYDDIENHIVLDKYQEYSHSETIEQLNNPNWN